MRIRIQVGVLLLLSQSVISGAFTSLQPTKHAAAVPSDSITTLAAESVNRRTFGHAIWTGAAAAGAAILSSTASPAPANAQVFFDPAMYGDQELRISAVDSVKERVRRAILQDPKLAPSFYQLSVLDGLSYNAKTNQYGPDGSIIKAVLTTKANGDAYLENLQKAALALIETEQFLRNKNAVSIADAVAIGGSEAIESIGGPPLTVQLGRADLPKNALYNPNVPLTLLSGDCDISTVVTTFKEAGLTEREMTALLLGLLTLETVEKKRTTEDWRQSAKPKFREPGKLGRMSDFKRLTEEDIAAATAQDELDDDSDPELDPDDGWYIADTFGTRESRFGERVGADEIDERSFNKYARILDAAIRKKDKAVLGQYGWIGELVTDASVPTCQTWINKYAGSNLNFKKDLLISYNSVTQLGAVYTGGKYENLLKGKPRKSLNDDEMKLF